jgi:integrase
MSTKLLQIGDNSVTILKKPVIGISEEDKNLLKLSVDKWSKNAKEMKVHKPVKLIAERDKLLMEWLFNTGMRISDALAIKYRDIDMQKEEVSFIVNKRSRLKPFLHTIS